MILKTIPISEERGSVLLAYLQDVGHSSVAIGKRMDEFEFVMKYATAHEWVYIGFLYPIKKVVHQFIHS